MTYSLGVVTTFINGLPVNTTTLGFVNLGTAGYTVPNTLRIGGREYANDAFFDGRIDEVGLQNRALTPAEVLALYNAAPPAPGGTITSVSPSSGAPGELLVVRWAPACRQWRSITVCDERRHHWQWVYLPVTVDTVCLLGPTAGRFRPDLPPSRSRTARYRATHSDRGHRACRATGCDRRAHTWPSRDAVTSTITPGAAVLVVADGMDTRLGGPVHAGREHLSSRRWQHCASNNLRAGWPMLSCRRGPSQVRSSSACGRGERLQRTRDAHGGSVEARRVRRTHDRSGGPGQRLCPPLFFVCNVR